MTFNKEYFESNCKTYKDMEEIKKIYFSSIINRENIKPLYKVLDVGCAFGYLLKCCDDYNMVTYGIDISEYAIKEAKKTTKARLFVNDIDSGLSMFEDNFFDIITMFDVIEHLASPYNALKELRRTLNKEGKLFITTPNANSMTRIVSGDSWYGFKDNTHIYLFTPTSLKHIVERAGFKIIELYAPFHPLPKIIQKIVNKTGLGGQLWLVGQK